MALTRRPRAGDKIEFPSWYSWKPATTFTVGFATDDGLCRNEKGEAVFIWRFFDGALNGLATIVEEGPDVPDPRSSLDLMYNGQPR